MAEPPPAWDSGYTRRSLRLPFRLAVEVLMRRSGDEPQRVRAMVQNLSAGGLMLELPVPIEPGSEILLEARTRTGEMLPVTAFVVWSRPHSDILRHGVRFPQLWGHEAVDQLFRTRFGGSG